MTKTTRIIAFFLVAGGLLGVFSLVLMGLHLAAVVPAVLFVWSIVTGTALWRGMPLGFRSAKILFALQVPVFSLARLTYEFSTLLSFRLMIGNTSHYIGGNIGSSGNIYVFPQSQGVMFGINIVAVLALLCLIRATHSASTKVRSGARLVEAGCR